MNAISGVSSPDISTTITTGEHTFPYRWTHRIRGSCVRQTRVGWSSFLILADCITTMNGWPRNRIHGRSVTWRATSYREGQVDSTAASAAYAECPGRRSADAAHAPGCGP